MATSPQEKAYCVLEYAKTSSVVVVQRHFRTKFFKELPHRHNIIRWMKQFEETGCLCKGKSRGRPPVRNEVVENIREMFVRSPTKSTRRASAELNVSQSIDLWQLKQRISDVLDSITPDMLAKVWQELDYRIDICRFTGGAHIEQL
ncbi:hypothetical protein lerEdw1_001943 [Lerista edwardsae]|nr:hypothetical protein lerEdw1_001943 [Lerista edwardsae]